MTATERSAIAAAVPPMVTAMDEFIRQTTARPVPEFNAEIRRNLGWGLIAGRAGCVR